MYKSLGIKLFIGIFNANGTELKPNFINYIKTETSHSRLRWPNQPKLYDKYWEAWINIIKTKD